MASKNPITVEPQFFGWDTPIIPVAALRLAEEFGGPPGLNLSHVTVAVPGQRSGRALLASLSRIAEQRGTVLLPPAIVTPGRIPELFYQSDLPEISALEAELLWVSLLRRDPERLAPLFPSAGETEKFAHWLGLARQLSRLRTELGATGKVIHDLLRSEFVEQYDYSAERWEVIAELMEEFEVELSALELGDPHSARARALEAAEFKDAGPCILLGVLELPPVAKEFLSRSRADFAPWIQAPKSAASGFDQFGSVVPSYWSTFPIQVPDEVIAFGRNPSNQAQECLRAISRWAPGASADDIAIAVPDEEIVPHIEEALEDFELPVRSAAGVPRSKVAPIFVLTLLAKFLASGSLQDLGSLIRHPDIVSWLARNVATKELADESTVTALDSYQRHALPNRVEGTLPGTIAEREQVKNAVRAIHLLAGEHTKKEAPLPQWCKEIKNVLKELYGERALRRGLNEEKLILETLELLDSELREIERLPASIAPKVSYGEAINLLVQRVGSERVEPNTFESAIELTGWLELYLDERPYVVVTACNEGFLPESANEDPFLPNGARRKLGITDNEIRYARDAAVLCALLHGRREVRLVVGGVGPLGDIRPPSRLLLTDPRTLSARAGRFYGAFEEEPHGEGERPDKRRSELLPRKPAGLAGEVKKARVTAIASYLECRYRFYLRYVEKLDELRDDAMELSALEFGTFGHEPLTSFARDPALSRLTDPEKIDKALSGFLDDAAKSRFGSNVLPAARLQIEQLRYRYKIFASWQAAWAASGWSIKSAEQDFEGEIKTSKGPLGLTARIDRIDFNAKTGEHAVFDYKFGNDGEEFYKRLKRKNALQLALYGSLLRQANVEGVIHLGIIPLTGSELTNDRVLEMLEPGELADLEAQASVAAEGILAGEFWPPTDKAIFGDPFRGICGVGAEQDDDDSDGEGADVTS